MPSFIINPGWYDTFWYSEGPHHKRGSFSCRLAYLGATIVFLVGSGVALNCFQG
jgi:hypothetical protein